MQQHQLGDGGGGVGRISTKASAGTAAGSLIIQLPSTSANNQSHHNNSNQHNQTATHQQAQHTVSQAGNVGQTAITGVHHWATALASLRDTTTVAATTQTRLNEIMYSSCHRQAATRDLMLKEHQQNNSRHKYWRRNLGGDPARGANASLLGGVNGQGEAITTTDQSQQHQSASITILNTTTATLTTTLSSSASSSNSNNESDNISDNSIQPPPNYHEIPGVVPSYHGRTSGPPPAYDDVVNPNAPPPSYQSLFGQVREARKTSNGLVDLLRQLFLVLIGTIGCTMIIGFLLLIPITMIFVGFFYINECRAENIPSFLVVGGFVWIIKNMLNCYNQFKKDSSTVNRPPPRRATHLSMAAASAASTPTTITMTTSTTTTTTETTTATPGSNQHLQEVVAPGGVPTRGAGSASDIEQAPSSSSNATATTRSSTQQSPNGGQASTHNHQHRHVRQPQMIGLTSDKCESILNYFLIVWFLAGCIVVYRIYEPDYDNPLSLSYCNRTVYLYAFWLMTSAFIIMAIVLSCLCCLMASSLMSCSHGR